MNWQQLAQQISDATGQVFEVISTHSISGGCINTAYQIKGQQCSYFVKLNRGDLLSMFEAEFAGLEAMQHSHSVRIPTPISTGLLDEQSFLLTEMIQLQSCRSDCNRKLGEQLAKMHQQPQPYFGWHRDNTIGATEQVNDQSDDWVSFWRQQRLGFQLDLAASKGYRGRLEQSGQQLCQRLDNFFTDYQPQPALLHGDLWSGNAEADSEGNPVIFDPACYYGDREADIAMTELFGGFGADFFDAYNDHYPLDSGYKVRKTLYNLYHILNHLNLFGSGYQRQAQGMIDQLLAEIR